MAPRSDRHANAQATKERLRRWYAAARALGLPPCCAARLAADAEIPLPRLGPLAGRLRALTPRYALAARWGSGIVPCEAHLVWWLVTNRRPACARTRVGGSAD